MANLSRNATTSLNWLLDSNHEATRGKVQSAKDHDGTMALSCDGHHDPLRGYWLVRFFAQRCPIRGMPTSLIFKLGSVKSMSILSAYLPKTNKFIRHTHFVRGHSPADSKNHPRDRALYELNKEAPRVSARPHKSPHPLKVPYSQCLHFWTWAKWRPHDLVH